MLALHKDYDEDLLAYHTCEDFWVYEQLKAKGIGCRHDSRYSIYTPPDLWPSIVTYHPLQKQMLDTVKLRALHDNVKSLAK